MILAADGWQIAESIGAIVAAVGTLVAAGLAAWAGWSASRAARAAEGSTAESARLVQIEADRRTEELERQRHADVFASGRQVPALNPSSQAVRSVMMGRSAYPLLDVGNRGPATSGRLCANPSWLDLSQDAPGAHRP